MSANRAMILKRFGKIAVFTTVSGLATALASSDFRAFVGDDLTATILLGVLIPILAAVEKWSQRK